MKTIEKTTKDGDVMFFEIIESRKELASWFRDQLWDALYSQYRTGTWDDEDSSIDWMDKDGTWRGTEYGEKPDRPNIANIAKVYSMNSGSVVIYGKYNIIQNERYGDWEAIEQ